MSECDRKKQNERRTVKASVLCMSIRALIEAEKKWGSDHLSSKLSLEAS